MPIRVLYKGKRPDCVEELLINTALEIYMGGKIADSFKMTIHTAEVTMVAKYENKFVMRVLNTHTKKSKNFRVEVEVEKIDE